MGSWWSKPNLDGPEAKFIESSITDNYIVVFSKTTCPYCASTKKLLNSLEAKFLTVELDKRDDMSEIQDALQSMTGARSVPRVFINGECIGGDSDTKRLHREGKLAELIQNAP